MKLSVFIFTCFWSLLFLELSVEIVFDVRSRRFNAKSLLMTFHDNGLFGLPEVPQPERYDTFDIPDFQTVVNVDAKNIEQNDNEIQGKQLLMRRQIAYAYDNLYEHEIDKILGAVWENNDPDVVLVRLKLLELTALAEAIEMASMKRGNDTTGRSLDDFADLGEEIRYIRSQIRITCDSRSLFKSNPQDNPLRINYLSGWVQTIKSQWTKFRPFKGTS